MSKKLIEFLFLKILIFILILLITSCLESSRRYWSLDNFQEIHTIMPNTGKKEVSFDFLCLTTSDNYKIELFFPDVKFKRYHAYSVKDSILKALDGFSLEIYNMETDKLVDKRTIDYEKQGHRENFFLEGTILSLPLISGLSVKDGKPYNLKIVVPPKRYEDDRINNIILGGGTAPPVFP